MINKLHNYLNTLISAAPLISFRLIFGALMVISAVRFIYLGWIEEQFVNPIFHFKYWGFEWVEPVSLTSFYIIYALLILSAIGVMLASGLLYRLASIILFLTFTYTELIDLTYYLNHYYFVSLISLLLIFSPATISPFKTISTQTVKRSFILILKIQIAILYIYAGLAKINYDWLIEALPLKIWLPAHSNLPILGPLLAWEFTPYLFSWAGMLFDTFIILFLLKKSTRLYAYLAVIVFHTLNGILFQIGVFPIVMIGIVTIFFSNKWHLKFIHFAIPIKERSLAGSVRSKKSSFFNYLFILYVGFQLIFPWRFLLYPGNLFWNEQGYRFSWRVMLMEKAGTAFFYVKDTKTGREGIVNNQDFLNAHQEKQMAMQPDMILQFAHYLGDYYKRNGVHDPEVRAEVYVTLNGRPSQLLIDPKMDLLKESDTFAPKKWILPYKK